MDIERVLTNFELPYLYGRSHHLAIALHRITGLPLFATFDVDDWTQQYSFIHAYVKDGEEGIDIRGRFPIATIKNYYPLNNPFEAEIDEEYLMFLGSGKTTALLENGKVYAAALVFAEQVVDELGINSLKMS